jgi:hypothetical protein
MTMSMDFDLDTKRSDDTAMPKLDPLPLAEPDSHWEGRLRGATGSARRANFSVAMRFGLRGGMISGAGSSAEFPYDVGPAQRTFTVTGQRSGATVLIDIWFDHDFMGRCAFSLSGLINEDESEINGSWTWRCKRECDCGGSSGTFVLMRVDDPA